MYLYLDTLETYRKVQRFLFENTTIHVSTSETISELKKITRIPISVTNIQNNKTRRPQ